MYSCLLFSLAFVAGRKLEGFGWILVTFSTSGVCLLFYCSSPPSLPETTHNDDTRSLVCLLCYYAIFEQPPAPRVRSMNSPLLALPSSSCFLPSSSSCWCVVKNWIHTRTSTSISTTSELSKIGWIRSLPFLSPHPTSE